MCSIRLIFIKMKPPTCENNKPHIDYASWRFWYYGDYYARCRFYDPFGSNSFLNSLPDDAYYYIEKRQKWIWEMRRWYLFRLEQKRYPDRFRDVSTVNVHPPSYPNFQSGLSLARFDDLMYDIDVNRHLSKFENYCMQELTIDKLAQVD